MSIYDNCLGGYSYIKYAPESLKTGDLNKPYITCQHAGHLFKFKYKGVILVAHPSYIYSSTAAREPSILWQVFYSIDIASPKAKN